jgi:hypothetical protein
VCAVSEALCAVSEVCAVSEALCSISDGHYTESDNCSFSDEEKGRRALYGRVLYLRKMEMCVMGAHLISQEKGEAHYGGASPFYLTA